MGDVTPAGQHSSDDDCLCGECQYRRRAEVAEAEAARLREGILRLQDEYIREHGIGASSDFIVARVEALLHG